jgi:hypothetical protein
MRPDTTPRGSGADAGGAVRRTRRRGEEVERAVLRAAVDELTERGYEGIGWPPRPAPMCCAVS